MTSPPENGKAKREWEERQLADDRFRDFAEAASDWFFEMDADLRFTYVSERHQEVLGVSPDQVIGKTRWEAHQRRRLLEEEVLWRNHIATMQAHQSWRDFKYTIIRDDGERRVISNSAKAIFDENGAFQGYRGVGRDVTDQASAEAQLNSILDVVADAIIITIDDQGKIASFSPASERLFGYSAVEVVGRNVKMLMPSPFRDEHDGYLSNYCETGDKKIIGIGREVEAQRKDGSVFPIHLAVNEMQVEGQRMFTGVVHDMKTLRQAQTVGSRLERILDQSQNEMYVFDAATLKFVRVNQGAQGNIRYSANELRQMTPVDIKPEFTEEQFTELVLSLRNGDKEVLVFETVHQRKDASTYPVEVHLQLMRDEIPPVFVAIIQDITQRKNDLAQLVLRDRAMEALDAGIMITDAQQDDNPIIYANPAIEKMTGYSATEIIGKNPRFLQGDDRDQPEVATLSEAIRNGEAVRVTLRNYRKDGTQFLNEVQISPVHDADGTLTNFIVFQNDVTERLERDAKLRQSQKMEAVGQLTGGIAHDFNNLLTIITGNNELLASRIGNDARAEKYLTASSAAAERSAKLTGQLLAFARQQPLDAKVIDLNALVDETLDMLQRTLGETIEISTELSADLGKTFADPSQVHNALLNLAINARDAMPNGGKLTIESSNVDLDADTARALAGATPGLYVRLSVRDTGTGIPPEVQARVFEPFFTTKEPGKGTGLGLSMVHGFAKQSGGHLELYSEVGYGTSVGLYLPDANEDAKVSSEIDDRSSGREAGGGTVLVVEDDADVREITVERLQHLGYRVVEAETAQDALDLLEKSSTVDVLLTDMVMPGGMTGADLVHEVRKTYPHIKAILSSGYAKDGTIPADDTPWLRKPYTLTDLANTLRELLR